MTSLIIKRSELWRLKARVNALQAEIAAEEQANARARIRGLGPHQRLVLQALCERYDPLEWRAYTFRGLSAATNLNRDQVRRACRALRSLGMAEHKLGLWTEDGEPVGAGYCATAIGAEWASTHGLMADQCEDEAA